MSVTFDKPLNLPLSSEQVDRINEYLSALDPLAILQWAVDNIPGLFQTTAFGLTGLVAIDMLSKITSNPPPLIFIDTLYHFQETYELVEEVKRKYNVPVTIYKPAGCADVKAFEEQNGEKLWERNETAYDFYVKVSLLSLCCAFARLTLISGRTGSTCICRAWSEDCNHRSARITRSGACKLKTARSR